MHPHPRVLLLQVLQSSGKPSDNKPCKTEGGTHDTIG